MSDGIDEVTMVRIRKERAEAQARYEAAPGLFLDAWKKGVHLAGERLFTNHRNFPAPSNIDAATDMWQLIPNKEAVNDYLGVASTCEALFVAVLYSFYNGQEGEKMIQELGFHGIGNIANRLEYGQLGIVTDLMKYHTGW